MKATVIGGATIDVIATIDSGNIESITMQNAAHSYLLMEQGAKVEASHIDTQMGGGATNASVSFSRLGASVQAVLMLGNDRDGDHVMDRLTSEKVSTEFVLRHASEPTGKSVIICSHERNAGVFVNRGSNSCLSAADITPQMFEGADLVYVSTLSSASADAFPHIVRLAKEAGAFVVCNPGIRQIRLRKSQVMAALKWVDLIAINREEARSLAEGTVPIAIGGLPEDQDLPDLISGGLGDRENPLLMKDLAAEVTNAGCAHLVVTNGAEGAYLATASDVTFCPIIPSHLESTIGAGDAFNSTLSFALVTGKSIADAMTLAVCNAASVAGHVDAQTGLQDYQTLTTQMASLDIYQQRW